MSMTSSGLLAVGMLALAVAAGGASCGSGSASSSGGSGGTASTPAMSPSTMSPPAATGGTTAAGSGGSGAPAAGGAGAGGTAGKGCTSDDMCRAMADYCTGCDCRGYGPGEQVAPCPGPGVRCLADPCRNKKAACQKGRCVVVDALPSVRPGKAYDPCAGKKCGDMCHNCPPDDADCMETAQVKQCNAAGKCGSEDPGCPGR
jgi:hypothetical protein